MLKSPKIQITLFLSIFDKVCSKCSINLPASVSGCLYAQQIIMFLHFDPVLSSTKRVSNSSCNAFKSDRTLQSSHLFTYMAVPPHELLVG